MQQSCSCRDWNVLFRETKFFAPSSLYTSVSRNCRGIIFIVATHIFLFILSTLSQQSFLCRDKISLVP